MAAVVEVADVDDAATLVKYARDEGVGLTVQPRGHGASGNVNGMILVRTDRLNSVEVDPDKESIRIGAGGNWGTVLTAAGKHGLTGLAGSAPGVSVAGFVLGGGLSWFSRKYGWGADSVIAFDIIDADGNQARVTAESDPDLFWALRGGGGDFTLVTPDLAGAARPRSVNAMWPRPRRSLRCPGRSLIERLDRPLIA